jgi:hypothetical protein
MYNSKLKIDIPKFSVSGAKDLEVALNKISKAVEDCAGLIPNINGGDGVRVIQSGNDYVLELDTQAPSVPPLRFQLLYDSLNDVIYVNEGRVAFISATELEVVVPTINGRSIAKPGSSDADLDAEENVPFLDVSTITDSAEYGVFLKIKDRSVGVEIHKIEESGVYGDGDYYHELARIRRDQSTALFLIDQRWSSDLVLSAISGGVGYCPFEVTDATTYDEEGGAIGDYSLLIKGDTIDGKRYVNSTLNNDWKYEVSIPSSSELLSHPYVYIYLCVYTNGDGELDVIDSTKIRSYFDLSSIPLDNGSLVQNFLLCRVTVGTLIVSVEGDSVVKKFLTDFANQCPIVQLDKSKSCHFTVEEGAFGSQELRIRKEYAEGQIPLPLSGQDQSFSVGYLNNQNSGVDFSAAWQILYLKFALDGEGNIDTQQASYVSIVAYDKYKRNNAYEQFIPIAEVTYGYTESDNPIPYVTSIKNYCPEPPYFIKDTCDFSISDYSTYDENGINPIDAVVRIKKSRLLGRLPVGMDIDGEPFTITISENDVDDAGVCHFYATALVDEYGAPYSFDTAVYIEYGKYSDLKTGGSIQRVKIGSVETVSSGGGVILIPEKIQSLCPAYVQSTASCKFQVSDVSDPYDTNNDIAIQIKSDSLLGRYPTGMQAGERYLATLTDENGWYAVYLCANYLPNGTASPLATDLYFQIENDYKKSDAYTERYLIAEVTISYREDSTRYISFIQNYCYEPELVSTNNCPFKIVDASESNSLGIVVRSSKVKGQFPSGMSYNDFFYLPVNLADGLWFSVYCGLTVNQSTGAIESVEVSTYTNYKTDDSATQYKLLGEVEVLYDEESNPYLYITNRCNPIEIYRYFSACPFRIKDVTDYDSQDVTPSISVDYGTVSGKIPEGMTLESPYLLEPSEGNNYLYLVIVFDETTLEISDAENSVTIGIYSETKLNTTTTQYILIGTVSWNSTTNTLTIYSVCTQPSANPCLLKWE